MANKRDTSKQKRARQNRAQRAALEARTTKANEPKRPSRAAPANASARTGGESSGGSSGEEEPKGFFARARAERGPRPGDVPVDLETLEGGWFTQRIQVPGGRQVLTGAILTLVVSVMTAFAKFVPEGGERGDPMTETVFDLFGTWAVIALAAPCLIYAASVQLTTSPHRRRVWIGGSFAITLVALSGAPFIIYLFPAGFLVYAVWKANRVEGPRRRGRAGADDDSVDEGPDDEVADDA